MNQIELSLDQASLKHRLDEIPQEIRPHLKMGFGLISRASADDRARFFRFVIDHFTNRLDINAKEAASLIGLNENTISDALSTASLSIGAAVDLDVSEQDFISFGREILFTEDDEPTVRELLQAIFQAKDQLKAAMKVGALSNLILPTFRNLSGVIDLRLEFSDADELDYSTPVAVFLLTTDCDDEITFQATLSGVKSLLKKLESVERRLEYSTKLRVSSSDQG